MTIEGVPEGLEIVRFGELPEPQLPDCLILSHSLSRCGRGLIVRPLPGWTVECDGPSDEWKLTKSRKAVLIVTVLSDRQKARLMAFCSQEGFAAEEHNAKMAK